MSRLRMQEVENLHKCQTSWGTKEFLPQPLSCSRAAGSSSVTHKATGNCSSAGCSRDGRTLPLSIGSRLTSQDDGWVKGRFKSITGGTTRLGGRREKKKLTVQHFLRNVIKDMLQVWLVPFIQPIENVFCQLCASLIISTVYSCFCQNNVTIY